MPRSNSFFVLCLAAAPAWLLSAGCPVATDPPDAAVSPPAGRSTAAEEPPRAAPPAGSKLQLQVVTEDALSEDRLEGVSATWEGADAPTLSDGKGLMTLELDFGETAKLRFSKEGFQPLLYPIWVPDDVAPGVQIAVPMLPSDGVARVRADAGLDGDPEPGTGMLLVEMDQVGPNGGEEAKLTVEHGGAFVVGLDRDLHPGSVLPAGLEETGVIIFADVPAGETGLELSSPEKPCVARAYGAAGEGIPIEADVITMVYVRCGEDTPPRPEALEEEADPALTSDGTPVPLPAPGQPADPDAADPPPEPPIDPAAAEPQPAQPAAG